MTDNAYVWLALSLLAGLLAVLSTHGVFERCEDCGEAMEPYRVKKAYCPRCLEEGMN